MGRYLQLALITATLGICAGYSLADNPPTSSTPVPAATTATHAMASTAAVPASTAAPQLVAAAATTAAESTPTVAAPTATTAASSPAASPSLSGPSGPGPSMPVRGMSMTNVEHIFGAPQEKVSAVPDPGTKLHPPITRWVYPDYVVYFEYNYVVHTVLKDHPFANSNPGGG